MVLRETLDVAQAVWELRAPPRGPGVEACAGQAVLHSRSPLGEELAHCGQSQGIWDNCSVRITGIDHIVLTVHSIEASVDFYSRVLGMEIITFGHGRTALRFGDQKINLHAADDPIAPHATQPIPGSADLCLVADGTIDEIREHLAAKAVPVELGLVKRTGARGAIRSLYVRDPDRNLVEIALYESA